MSLQITLISVLTNSKAQQPIIRCCSANLLISIDAYLQRAATITRRSTSSLRFFSRFNSSSVRNSMYFCCKARLISSFQNGSEFFDFPINTFRNSTTAFLNAEICSEIFWSKKVNVIWKRNYSRSSEGTWHCLILNLIVSLRSSLTVLAIAISNNNFLTAGELEFFLMYPKCLQLIPAVCSLSALKNRNTFATFLNMDESNPHSG